MARSRGGIPGSFSSGPSTQTDQQGAAPTALQVEADAQQATGGFGGGLDLFKFQLRAYTICTAMMLWHVVSTSSAVPC
jgi:hypothetical protein